MAVIPRLAQLRAPIIRRTVPSRRLIEPRPGAPDVRLSPVRIRQRILDVGERVGGAVGRRDAGVGEPGESGQAPVEEDGGLEEVDDVFVRLVARAVAGEVEGREAGRVLGELVRPEIPVGLVLRDPVANGKGAC